MHIIKLIDESHRISKKHGFWDTDKTFPEYMMLVVGEISEAVEAHRCGNIDKMKEEIADIFIRLCDACGRWDIDIESEIVKKMEINKKRKRLHGKLY